MEIVNFKDFSNRGSKDILQLFQDRINLGCFRLFFAENCTITLMVLKNLQPKTKCWTSGIQTSTIRTKERSLRMLVYYSVN